MLDRELGADFDPDAFEHVAAWDAEQEWIEMRLRSRRDQTVHVRALASPGDLAEGEEMRTEVSAKFRPETIEARARAAGLRLTHLWTDAAGRLRAVALDAGVSSLAQCLLIWRTRRRSCRIRRLPATAARNSPAAVAISSATARGVCPLQPRNETLTLWVFWAMKTTRSRSTRPSPTTATQIPLVREPRSGSLVALPRGRRRPGRGRRGLPAVRAGSSGAWLGRRGGAWESSLMPHVVPGRARDRNRGELSPPRPA